ncbi:MAG: hypothetical protein K6F86_09005 [Lachnospiraceae bacterium]|nr:hypothetical protein [Lachnospiraceae bacterium]
MIKYNYADYYMEDTIKADFLGHFLKDHGMECEMSDTPDYLLCYRYTGDTFLKYDGVRIFWTGEDVSPDFNLVDYAIGFDHISFGDRYFRRPLYLGYKEDWELAKKKHLNVDRSAHERKFCNFVYSNGNAVRQREDFYHILSKYKKIDSGGRYLNNVGGPVDNKCEFQKNYKFSIAFENASTPGYVTEKITQAFAAGTVPIYWGNPLVADEFNTKAFINCHDFSSFDEVIKFVKEVDENDELYYGFLNEPMCTDEQLKKAEDTENKLEEFLLNIFTQPYEKAFRRNMGFWGRNYEMKMKRQLLDFDMDKAGFTMPLKVGYYLCRRKLGIVKRKLIKK